VTSVSALRLDSDRIRGLIADRFGGSISRLAAALPLDEPPDRSTVTRWLSSDGRHFPRDEERILALAGALDVDPTALWTFDPENFPTLWPKIVRASRTGRWSGLLKALAFFRYFSDQAEEWPPQPMARRFFNREWVVNEFAHDPRDGKNFYQDLVVRPRRPQGTFPTVWHFAFRHGGVRGAKWQPFGFVRRDFAFPGAVARGEAVADPGHRLDPFAAVGRWSEQFPERGDLDREVAFLDRGAVPRRREAQREAVTGGHQDVGRDPDDEPDGQPHPGGARRVLGGLGGQPLPSLTSPGKPKCTVGRPGCSSFGIESVNGCSDTMRNAAAP